MGYKEPTMQKNTRPEFRTWLMRCCQCAAGIDVLLLILFNALGSYFLAWFNIISILIYGTAFWALKNKRQNVAIILMWTEVFVHAGISVIFIGWESGFNYYLFMFIPAICLSTSKKLSYIAIFAILVFYLSLNTLMWFIDPIQPINTIALKIVYTFNVTVVFIMFSYMSFFYLHRVRSAQKKLHSLATTDSLTKLSNRRFFTSLAEEEILRTNNENDITSIMLIDIDYFKVINDTYGHQIGDDVLVTTASILKNSARKKDQISRWGGEEFLLMIPDINVAEVEFIAQRIRKAFQDYEWQKHLGVDVKPTISIGVTELKKEQTLNAAISNADIALYRCKNNGRNRVEFESITPT